MKCYIEIKKNYDNNYHYVWLAGRWDPYSVPQNYAFMEMFKFQSVIFWKYYLKMSQSFHPATTSSSFISTQIKYRCVAGESGVRRHLCTSFTWQDHSTFSLVDY